MRKILGILLLIIGFIGAIYIAIVWGLITPIMNIAEAFDANILTATFVAKELVRIFFREIVASLWILVTFTLVLSFIK